jgi:hypothetical protein
MPTLIFPCDSAADAEHIMNDIRSQRENRTQEFGMTVEEDANGHYQVIVLQTRPVSAKSATATA